MEKQTNLYAFVMTCLRSRAIPQREVAQGAGVPFSTLTKIAQGSVTDPSVHTVQRLYDYFVQHPQFSQQAPSHQPTSLAES